MRKHDDKVGPIAAGREPKAGNANPGDCAAGRSWGHDPEPAVLRGEHGCRFPRAACQPARGCMAARGKGGAGGVMG
jgi:hypothetical protein